MECKECKASCNPRIAFCHECGARLFELDEDDGSLTGRMLKARREHKDDDEVDESWQYGPLGLRLGAALLDYALLGGGFYAWYYVGAQNTPINATPSVLPLVVGGMFWLLYEPFMTAGWGGTIGKLAFRMKVSDDFGDRPGVGRAYLRFLAKALYGIPLAGLVMLVVSAARASRDEERRMLHDRMAGTWVRPAGGVD